MAIAPHPSSAVASAPAVGVVQGEGREPGLVVFEEALVGFFVEAADLLGVPKSVAIIYGIVFASPQPVSFAEIEARLARAGEFDVAHPSLVRIRNDGPLAEAGEELVQVLKGAGKTLCVSDFT